MSVDDPTSRDRHPEVLGCPNAADSRVEPMTSVACLEVGVAVERVPVLLVVARAVAHGVRILALDQGPRLGRVVNEPSDLGDARVHGAHDVGGRRLRPAALVVHRPAGVPRPDVACGRRRSITSVPTDARLI